MDLHMLIAGLVILGVGLVVGIWIGYALGREMAEMLRARFDMMYIWRNRRDYRSYF